MLQVSSGAPELASLASSRVLVLVPGDFGDLKKGDENPGEGDKSPFYVLL